MLMKQSESIKNNPQKKICPECGQLLKEHIESYIMECDRCLSKKAEQTISRTDLSKYNEYDKKPSYTEGFNINTFEDPTIIS